MSDKTDRFDDREERRAEEDARRDYLASKPPRKVLRMIDGKMQEPLAKNKPICKNG